MTSPAEYQQCQVDWDDGWGHGHACHRPLGHMGFHRCRCDQEMYESEEQTRQRLRQALIETQEETT